VNWEQVFHGLKDAEYQGPLVLESFSANNPALIAAIRLWRPPAQSPEHLAREGLKFLKEWSERVSL
jgi:D-psicose/D-tagatose/L-ribulose 3-epimerase